MATNYQHGSLGSATSNGVTACLTGWDVTETNDLVDVTTTCSGGWHEMIGGLKSVDGTISGDWDLNQSPYTTLSLVPGTKVTLVLNVSASVFWSMSAFISDFKATVDVGDVIKWTASFKSTGAVVRPI